MTVYEQWEQLTKDLSKEGAEEFEREYYPKEQTVYQAILAEREKSIKGTFDELAKRFSFSQAMFAGFMEGINTSLENSVDVASLTPETEVSLKVDFERLYENMLKAKAEWLYTLEEWEDVLDGPKRREITKRYHDSLQAKSTKIDRNAPCPCGSGKKYKKCCGANISNL